MSTVSDVAQMAKNTTTSVKVCWVEGRVKIRGRMTAINSEEDQPALVGVAGPPVGLEAGPESDQHALGVNAKTSWSSPLPSGLNATATSTAMSSSRLISPGVFDEVEGLDQALKANPITMLATMARRNEVMPAMTAATSASESVWSPRVVASPAEPELARDEDDTKVWRVPAASAHTKVETIFGLMADSRASCGLLAHALTVRPMVGSIREPGQGDQSHGGVSGRRSNPRTLHARHRPRSR